MKTVIEMAREAGAIRIHEAPREFALVGNAEIEHFAELVRADEREKYKWDIHSCGPTCKRYACVAMREAVEAENEACAKLCDGLDDDIVDGLAGWQYGESIRARRKT
jgi:hypothetical protein